MRHLVLEIICGTCQRDGDPNPPRLVRFERTSDGRVEVKPFTANRQKVIPYPHRRPDGGWTWQLVCPQGHDRPVRHERVLAALDAFPPDQDSFRIPL